MDRTELERPMEAQPGSGAMFDRIALRYDVMNRVLSFGIDLRWRALAVRAAQTSPCTQILDLATGTADLAIALARAVPGAHVVGVDPSSRMLEVAEKKIEAAQLAERVRVELGDAQALSFADEAFDAVTMAFGIRNVPDRDRALREMARVTRPRGRVVILELAEPRAGLLSQLARLHVHFVVPALGALLSGASEYAYLQRSIAAFPEPHLFAPQITRAGLELDRIVPLSFGVATLYVAHKPDFATNEASA